MTRLYALVLCLLFTGCAGDPGPMFAVTSALCNQRAADSEYRTRAEAQATNSSRSNQFQKRAEAGCANDHLRIGGTATSTGSSSPYGGRSTATTTFTFDYSSSGLNVSGRVSGFSTGGYGAGGGISPNYATPQYARLSRGSNGLYEVSR